MTQTVGNSSLETANQLLQQGKIQEAVAEYRRGIELTPDLSWHHYYLGEALTQLEDWEGAVQAYRQAISLGSNYLCYYRLGVALVKLELWDEAIATLNQGLELKPDYYKFYLPLGQALVHQQHGEAAIEAYGKAVALKPGVAEFNLQLGHLLRRQGRFTEAVGYLQQAADFQGDDPQLQLGLGVALVEAGTDLQRAEASLRRSLELQPDQGEAYFYLGKLEGLRGRWDEALAMYRRSWEINPQVGEWGLALAEALEKLGRWSEAVDQYRQVVLELGESGEASLGLGRALVQLERPVEAVVELRRAVKLGVDRPEVHRLWAGVLVELGRWPDVVEQWQWLLERYPGAADMRRRLALALMGLGRWPEAAAQWGEYWRVAPGSGRGSVMDFRRELGTYGEIDHRQELSITGDLTVEFWLYLRRWPESWTDILAKKESLERNEFCFLLKNGKVGKWYYGYGKELKNPVSWVPREDMRLHEWVHVACVRKVGEYGRIYFDGVLRREADWSGESEAVGTEATVRLMAHSNGKRFNDGKLSELRIWNRARSADEIRQGMYEALTGDEPGLVGVWHGSDEGVLVDAVGHHQGRSVMADAGKERLRVGVCGWELSHNAAGRAYTLAQLYGGWAEVELIGCLFPRYGGQVWEPIRGTQIPCHTVTVADEGRFVEQALGLVLAHPYEVVHLSKPRIPNIVLGLLYKLVWGARVIVDIDDEELAFVKASEPVNWREFLGSGEQLPKWKHLDGQKWTRIAVGLAQEFDGVTVSNPALQERYGGVVIRHARDEGRFVPSSEGRRQSRERLGIAPDKKVVLFFGTPRSYKGLVATARALASLGRQDVVFAIIGDFTDGGLKEKLQGISGVDYVFVGNQPFESIPDVVAAGDICVLLQDVASEVSQYQIPAKLSDALGMGLVVLLSETAAVADVIESGAVVPVAEGNLAEALGRLLSEPAEMKRLGALGRELLAAEFGFEVNISRLAGVVEGVRDSAGFLSEGFDLLWAGFPAVGSVWSSLVSHKTITKGKKIIVYTCNFGNYESVKEPLAVDPRVEYILFTDRKDIKSQTWKVVQINDFSENPRRASRLPKILPHKYLPQHDISVYIDSSLELKTPDVLKMVEECMEGHDIALYKHYKRNCVYDEIHYVMNSKDRVVYNRDLCQKALEKYESINYPKNNGLFENAFIFRTNTTKIKYLNELWWKEYQEGTERDQFTLMYALFLTEIKPNTIKVGHQFRDNKYVNFYSHVYRPLDGIYSENLDTKKLVNTMEENKYDRIVRAISSNRIKVVSFDIFDTLLTRRCLEPQDLFLYLAEDRTVKTILNKIDFSFYRVLAENSVRERLKKQMLNQDPTIDNIYEELGAVLCLSVKEIDKLKQIEIDTELQFISRRDSVGRLYEYTKRIGKELILCSDMYLPRSVIIEMLTKCGYEPPFNLYLSCESNATKKHGTIFPVVARQLNVEIGSILHIGDNLNSDIKMPESVGCKAMRINDYRKILLNSLPNTLIGIIPPFPKIKDIKSQPTRYNYALILERLFADSLEGVANLENASNFGYTVLGPFVLSLVLWLRRVSEQKGIQKVAWLARDGYLPLQVCKLVDSVAGKKYKSIYLPISRKVLFPYFLQLQGGIESILEIGYTHELTVEKFVYERFGKIGLNIIQNSVGKHFEIVLSSLMIEHHEYVFSLLRNNVDYLKNETESQYNNLINYYREALGNSARTALFDVGRKGTFQSALSQITGLSIHGFYIINNYEIYKNAPGRTFDSYLGMIDKFARSHNPDTILYEAFLSEKGASFVGFDSIGNPLRESKNELDRSINQIFFDDLHKGALDFVKDAAKTFGERIIDLEQESFYSSYGLENWMHNESVKKMLANVPHEDPVSTLNPRTFSEKSFKITQIDPYFAFAQKSHRKRIMIYCPAISRIRGGAERIAARVANYLIVNGYEVLIFSSGNRHIKPHPVYPLSPGVIVRNVDVRNVEVMSQLVKSYSPSAALVLASGSVLVRISQAFLNNQVPYMLSERASPVFSMDTYWKGFNIEDYYAVYMAATMVSVQFESFKTFFPHQLRDRIVVLPNPIQIPEKTKVVREKVILCVARIWFQQKRQDILLKAFAKASFGRDDWKLKFFGHEYHNDGSKLKNLSEELGITDKIEINGSITNIDMQFAKSSIFVLPSAFEGFPNSLAEALASGIPSIGFKSCPGVNELIVDQRNGLLIDDVDLWQINAENKVIPTVEDKAINEILVNRLCESLTWLMDDDIFRSRASKTAIQMIQPYQAELVLERWQNAVEVLCKISGSLSLNHRVNSL